MTRVILGDSLVVLPTLAENSVDACVTDPPYHLVSVYKRFANDAARNEATVGSGPYGRHARGFMGKEWDGGDIAFRPETWAAVRRVLKPGAHLLAFGGTRTHHRIWCAVEDAGFEIRDTLMWVYGSGFPKSHNAGDGWGTALKPAFEPIILARKPLVGTIAENVMLWDTGAINIDGCWVDAEAGRPWRQPSGLGVPLSGSVDGSLRNQIEDRTPRPLARERPARWQRRGAGRFPLRARPDRRCQQQRFTQDAEHLRQHGAREQRRSGSRRQRLRSAVLLLRQGQQGGS